MKNTLLWALIALNVVLLACLIGRTPGNEAMAQARLQAGTYLACPGEVVGGGAGGAVVYILDTRNFILTAVQQTPQNLEIMPPVNLAQQLGAR